MIRVVNICMQFGSSHTLSLTACNSQVFRFVTISRNDDGRIPWIPDTDCSVRTPLMLVVELVELVSISIIAFRSSRHRRLRVSW